MNSVPNKPKLIAWIPLVLGIFLLANEMIWITVSGGGWFELDPRPSAIQRVFGVAYMLAFFTTQTNLFLGVMFIIIARYQTNRAYSWFMGSTMLMMITFFAYWSLLLDFDNKIIRWDDPYFTLSTLFTHGINPFTGFIFLFTIRKRLIIDKRILGRCALHMMIFYTFNALLYGVASQVVNDEAGRPVIIGGSVYGFLNLQRLFMIDFSANPAAGVIANLALFLFCPFFPIGCSSLWIKVAKIQTTTHSYYRWLDHLQNRYRQFKTRRGGRKSSRNDN